MPMHWTAEANAKLFIGVLEQIKNQSVKLDYKALAEHMGPECNAKSIQNQFTKLKKQAAEECGNSGVKSSAILSDTPKKRRAPAGSKVGTPDKKKKGAAVVMEDDSDAEGETDTEQKILKEIKAELKDME
ncbi:hypothetical protein BDW75DRAFT_216108 [Aspergillus navahoensis]